MRKYDHVERFDHVETRDIDVGTCHVFPKLDGTNARVQVNGDMSLTVGSRNRIITPDDDNFGFAAWCHGSAKQRIFAATVELGDHTFVFHGEWLVPHTLKTYRDDAWHRFYVFDVWDMEAERYLHYDDYAEPLRVAGLDVVDPLAIVENPTENTLRAIAERNTYLIAEGQGVGEGVVLKNYAWRNRFGRQPWAKFVLNEFKEKHVREMGATRMVAESQVEAAIAEEFCTRTLVDKERAKIAGEPRHAMIPRLLGTVYYCVVTEELWAALKKYKYPTIDFRRLRKFIEYKVKEHAADLF